MSQSLLNHAQIKNIQISRINEKSISKFMVKVPKISFLHNTKNGNKLEIMKFLKICLVFFERLLKVIQILQPNTLYCDPLF